MLMNNVKRSRSVHGIVISSMLAASLLGSTTMLGGCQTTNRYQADYSNDVCKVQRDALQATGKPFAEDLIAGAVAGAVGGALLGGLTAAMTGGSVGQGMVVGAVAGGITGFGVGYYNALARKQGQTTIGLFTSLQSDAERDTAQLAKTQAAFNALVDCRKNEIASVKAAVKAKSMTRADGDARLAEIRQKFAEDIRVARDIQGNLEDRAAQYAVAGAKLGVPGAQKRAEQAYVQKAKTNASEQKPDLTLAVSTDDTKTPAAKKTAQSVSAMFAGTDSYSRSIETANAGIDKDAQFSWLGAPAATGASVL